MKIQALVGLVMVAAVIGLVTVYRNGFEDRAVASLNRSLEIDLRIPTEARMSDGSCERLLAIAAHAVEVCLTNTARPRLLFIGDSHSMAMFNAIYEKAIDVPAVLVAAHSDLWARPECLTAFTLAQKHTDTEACRHVIRDAVDLIGRLDSIQAVVIVPFSGNPFFQNRERVGALQEYALQRGKQVVYVLSVPSFASPAACSPRTIDLFGYHVKADALADACRATRASVEDDDRSQRRFLENMARGNTKVHLYDPTSVFCDTVDCRQSDEQGVFFWMSGHVNLRGSQKVLRDFLPWFRKDLALSD